MEKDLAEIWKITLAQLEVKLDSPAQFKTWFKSTNLLDIQGNKATIGVKNAYSCDWLKKRHNGLIRDTLAYVYGQQLDPEYVVDRNLVNSPDEKVSTKELEREAPMFQLSANTQAGLDALLKKSKLSQSCTFANYIVGSSNKLAHAAALGVARNPGSAFNPLFIYGRTGLGKTHLSQAIGRYILEQDPSKAVLYVSSEGFLNDMVKSIRSGKSAQFRQKYRTLDLLIIDDIQFLSKWQETQNEFFNTFNVLYNEQKQIILISDRPPNQIEKIEDRLRSRFQGGMLVDITRPDYEMRLAILEKKAESLNVNLPSEVMVHIAKLITDNVREMEGALQKITLYNSMRDDNLSKEEIANILGKDTKSKRENIKTATIIKKIAKEFNLTVKELKGPRRKADIAFARQICMYILREEYGYKLEQVAKFLERKDHTTVLHAVDKIKSKLLIDDGFKNQMDLLKESIVNE